MAELLAHRVPTHVSAHPVQLRPWTMSDLAALVTIYSDPQSANWIDVPQPYSLEVARGFVERTARSRTDGTARHFAVVDDVAEAVVGSAYLHDIDEIARTTEISWLVHPAHRGQGFAPMAATALSGAALDAGFQHVLARISAGNPASVRAAKRAGFSLLRKGEPDDWWSRSATPGADEGGVGLDRGTRSKAERAR